MTPGDTTPDGPLDAIIVGAGLAGATLAWRLADAGWRILLQDPAEPVTCSRIAAGLMTPITGERMALSWQIGMFLADAIPFYRDIEARTGRHLLHERVSIRLFTGEDERRNWEKRLGQPGYADHLAVPAPEPLVDGRIADASSGGFAMKSWQLDVAAFLDTTRAALPFARERLDWSGDVSFDGDGARVGKRRTRVVVSCEGHGAKANPYLRHIPFTGARGDILTLRFAAPLPPRSLHQGVWLAPTADPAVFRAGATFDRLNLDAGPTAAGRAEIEARLSAFLHLPYKVIAHEAAVRPVISLSKPVIGRHPAFPALGVFNGLASKGSLQAPWYARAFAEHLVDGVPIPAIADAGRFAP